MYTLKAEGKHYAVAVRNGSVNVEPLPNGLKEAWLLFSTTFDILTMLEMLSDFSTKQF